MLKIFRTQQFFYIKIEVEKPKLIVKLSDLLVTESNLGNPKEYKIRLNSSSKSFEEIKKANLSLKKMYLEPKEREHYESQQKLFLDETTRKIEFEK